MTLCCTSPGKLFLSGEYAVLHGAPAVITAVNRRAVADLEFNDHTSSVVEAVRREAAKVLTSVEGELPQIRAYSPNFRIRGKKVGIGSSAAVCAAACGTLYEWAGLPIEENQSQIVDTAIAAHRASQNGKGSGGDVAVSVLGGTIVFSIHGQREQVSNPQMELVALWSGRSASTTFLVDRVNRYAAKDESAHSACMKNLFEVAGELADGYRLGEVKRIIEHTKNYGAAMDRLGRGAEISIVTSEHKLIANLAKKYGGGAKPSGAGGGDAAIAVFDDPDAARSFKIECFRFGFPHLDLEFQTRGLRREEEGSYDPTR